jgi:hypothetical protein
MSIAGTIPDIYHIYIELLIFPEFRLSRNFPGTGLHVMHPVLSVHTLYKIYSPDNHHKHGRVSRIDGSHLSVLLDTHRV